jgi:glycosyltransferase involved in cell wall biosynthesis
MRVLQFGRFYNNQYGGIERHVAFLSHELAAQGVDVVNLVAADGFQGSDTRIDGYRVIKASSLGMALSTAIAPALVFKALALHREKKFDILHLHLPDPLSHVASLMLPTNVKRVITWHSDIVRQKRLLALYLPFLRRLVSQADALVAATDAHFTSSTQIPKSIPPERRHVIPYGMDFRTLALTPLKGLLSAQIKAKAAGGPLIFALGRHVYYKGFDVLIHAMKQIDALLVLGGDGPLRAELEALADQEGLAGKILFTGRIPEEDLPSYFHACDVFCLPSVEPSEAFGLVQLEAMACGKPVVCTQLNNGVNIVNVAGETGLAVPVRDPVALGAAINRLLEDHLLRERLGQQAQQRAITQYSLQAMAQRHIRLYQDLLSTDR